MNKFRQDNKFNYVLYRYAQSFIKEVAAVLRKAKGLAIGIALALALAAATL